jgi:hypothetical protein
MNRLLVLAKSYNQAQHWAKAQNLSLGRWVYVSSYHNILGNAGCDYVELDGWKERPDADILLEHLSRAGCKKDLSLVPRI